MSYFRGGAGSPGTLTLVLCARHVTAACAKIRDVNLRFVRLVSAGSFVLLLIAKWFELGSMWTLPLGVVAFGCGVIHVAEDRHARGDDRAVVLDLHR